MVVRVVHQTARLVVTDSRRLRRCHRSSIGAIQHRTPGAVAGTGVWSVRPGLTADSHSRCHSVAARCRALPCARAATVGSVARGACAPLFRRGASLRTSDSVRVIEHPRALWDPTRPARTARRMLSGCIPDADAASSTLKTRSGAPFRTLSRSSRTSSARFATVSAPF